MKRKVESRDGNYLWGGDGGRWEVGGEKEKREEEETPELTEKTEKDLGSF